MALSPVDAGKTAPFSKSQPSPLAAVAKVAITAIVLAGTAYMIYATNGFTLGIFTATYICGAAFLLTCAIAVLRPGQGDAPPLKGHSRSSSLNSSLVLDSDEDEDCLSLLDISVILPKQ